MLVGIGAIAMLPQLRSARPLSALPAPRFVEEAATSGLVHRYDGDFEYYVGGGVAAFDCDGDGIQDLYLAGGSQPAALFRNRSEVGGTLAFDPVPGAETDLEHVTGAYPLDIDGDGIKDLVVLRVGETVVLRGTGDCRFERANEALGYDAPDAWTAAFSATWESEATLPTLAFGHYLDLDSVTDRTYICADGELVRPDATGRSYDAAVALIPGYCPLSMLFSDWDRSGRRDLRVSNDAHYYRGGAEQLWRITPGQPPEPWTSADGWQPLRVEGMGIASYDVTGDGYPDVYLTSQGDNKLQALADGAAQPRYEDIAIRSGATAHEPYAGDTEMRSTAWHDEFSDVNNDGFIDLLVTKGNVEAQPDYAMRDPNNLLIGQADGTFVEGGTAAGIVSFARGRGAAVVDLNLDGLLDMVIVNRRENVAVWRNLGGGTAAEPEAMGNWIGLQLAQDGPNRDAVGAWVEVTAGDRIMRREITVGGGHASGQMGWIHVGIGTADRATVRVTWPDGDVAAPMEVAANGFTVVEHGASEARPWQPTE